MNKDSKVKIIQKANRQDVYSGMVKKKDADERFRDQVAFFNRQINRKICWAGACR